MLNGATDFEQIAGVIHRPEGLHRMMNLCLVTIYRPCLSWSYSSKFQMSGRQVTVWFIYPFYSFPLELHVFQQAIYPLCINKIKFENL